MLSKKSADIMLVQTFCLHKLFSSYCIDLEITWVQTECQC